jgi:eukaryotic-like serine/threonine-protein kinase
MSPEIPDTPGIPVPPSMAVRLRRAVSVHPVISAVGLTGLGLVALLAGYLSYRGTAVPDGAQRAAEQCAMVRTDVAEKHYRQANERLPRARAMLTNLRTVPAATMVECLRAEAAVAEAGRNVEIALTNLQQARGLLENSAGIRGLQYEEVLADLVGIYARDGRFREAMYLNEHAFETLDASGRGSTSSRVRLETERASILLRLGEVLRAHSSGYEAMRRSDPETMATAAVVYAESLNRLERASEAIAILSKLRSDDATPLARYHLGEAQRIAGLARAATAQFEKLRREWSTREILNREPLADLSRSFAELELARGRVVAAREHIDAALVGFDYPRDRSRPGVVASLIVASRIYLQDRQLERAEVFARAALATSQERARNPADSADVGEALLALAAIRRAKDDAPGARAFLGRAVESLSNSLGAEHRLTRAAIRAQRAVQ